MLDTVTILLIWTSFSFLFDLKFGEDLFTLLMMFVSMYFVVQKK